jgi:hypothetical protein
VLLPAGDSGGSPATLPATTPQAFKGYLNAHFKGDNQKLGGTVAALGQTGSTLGDQWLSWYALKHAKDGSKFTLLEYEEAFVLLWEDATLGGDLAAATTVGATDVGNFGNAAVAGTNNFYNSTLFGGLTKLAGELDSSAFWLRAVKVIVGGVLLIVGLSRITGVDNAVTNAVKKVPVVPI